MRSLGGFLILSVFLLPSCAEPKPPEDDEGASTESTATGGSTGETGDGSGSDGGGTSTGNDTSGTGGTGTGTDSTSSVVACTGECVDPAPDGWEGPIAIASQPGDSAPGCSGDYPSVAFAAHEGLDVPQGDCGCECGEPLEMTCPTEVNASYGSSLMSCADFLVTGIGQSCTPITPVPVNANTLYWKVVMDPPTGESCPSTLTPVLGAPSWASTYSGCEGDLAEGTCEDPDDLCVSSPSEPLAEAVCIWQLGDVECPEGDYGAKILLHGSYDDTRDCEACVCGEPTGTCTVPVARMHAQDACACATSACDFDTICTLTPFDTVIAGLELITPPTVHEAWCEPSDPQVTGEAAPTEPRTLCCTG